jgi:hypothetical protein
MRQLLCPHCNRTTDEASSDWDRAHSTGRCPACGAFFEHAREAEAQALSHAPALVRQNRKARLATIVVGGTVFLGTLAFMLVGLANGHVWLGGLWFLVPSGSWLLFGLLNNNRSEARSRVQRATNLDRFTSKA